MNWYVREGRDLPWRRSSDPYKIWISEVILQQTRVAQGLEYYLRFIESFPDIKSLASADEKEVFKKWEGLGYYTRAANLMKAAKELINNYDGKFPSDYEKILSLPGIGPYTAGAISSIAFNIPVSAIDGNVRRVISRLFGLEGNIKSTSADKEISRSLDRIFDKKQPGLFNQAVMDLGALICTPASPLCEACPIAVSCFANLNNRVGELPVSYSKTRQRNRYLNYYIIKTPTGIFTRQRQEKDIWKSLFEFVLLETKQAPGEKELLDYCSEIFPDNTGLVIQKLSPEIKHVLSHQTIYTRFIHVKPVENDQDIRVQGYYLSSEEELALLPFPRLISRYLEENGL